jgi:hypothetical protein
MDDNLYDRPKEDEAPPTEEREQQGQGTPVLVNKEAWPDAKPGETRMFRVMKVMEQEIEGVFEEGEGGEKEMPPEEPAMAGEDGGMGGMME